MEERDFEWCFEHENLFREWLRCIYNLHKSHPDERLESDSIFSLWQKAKECALEIANSEEPGLLYRIRMNDVITKRPNHWKGLMYFLNSMLASSKNKNLEIFANIINKTVRDYLNKNKIDENSIDEFAKDTVVQTLYLASGQVKSDYDYSLPDGGIKDETQTDETKTITDETQTGTEEESVDVILPKYNALNDEDFISAMRKAIEIGWIEKIEDSRYKWIGPKIYKGSSDSALVYFIGKALNLKTDVERVKDPATGIMKDQLTDDSRQDAINRFPKEEINSLFGKSLIISQWKQIFKVNKKQVWREVIDKFFDENKENKENNIQ